MNKFPENLKMLRGERKVSQKELADAIKSQQSSINRMEHGLMDPSGEYLIKMADFFDVSVDFLLGRTDIREMASTDSETRKRIKEAVFDFLTDNPKMYKEIKKGITSYINGGEKKSD